MKIDSIPDEYFEGKRFTREDLRKACQQLLAELRSPEVAEAFGSGEQTVS